jgi:TRAP-type mannitol/chloroaromatic compound transport system substrate-binding protein
LDTLINKHKVNVLALPDDVIKKLKQISEEVVLELANKDPVAKKIYTSVAQFRKQVTRWADISELAYLKARSL